MFAPALHLASLRSSETARLEFLSTKRPPEKLSATWPWYNSPLHTRSELNAGPTQRPPQYGQGQNMQLYTLLIELLGGTYISQVDGETPTQAAHRGIGQLKVQEIEGLEESDLTIMQADLLEENGLVTLNGAVNVWCTSFLIHDNLLLMNLIKTSVSGEALAQN